MVNAGEDIMKLLLILIYATNPAYVGRLTPMDIISSTIR
jgi:hypothetical protein